MQSSVASFSAFSRPPEKWTEAEDAALIAAMRVEHEECVDWNRVAQTVSSNGKGRDRKQCPKRWVNTVSGKIKKGHWTTQEDHRMLDAINEVGFQWNIVAERVQTRTGEQCSKRWTQALNPDLQRGPWSSEEDRRLVECMSTMDNNWSGIAQMYFQDRSALSVKNRWRLLTRVPTSLRPSANARLSQQVIEESLAHEDDRKEYDTFVDQQGSEEARVGVRGTATATSDHLTGQPPSDMAANDLNWLPWNSAAGSETYSAAPRGGPY